MCFSYNLWVKKDLKGLVLINYFVIAIDKVRPVYISRACCYERQMLVCLKKRNLFIKNWILKC